MIIWNGLGFVVAILAFGTLLFAEVVSEKLAHNDQFYQENSWVMSIGMVVAAVLTFGFSLFLQPKDSRTVVDEQTGERFELQGNSHSLFFIPVKWWPVVFVVLSVVVLFVE